MCKCAGQSAHYSAVIVAPKAFGAAFRAMGAKPRAWAVHRTAWAIELNRPYLGESERAQSSKSPELIRQ